MKKYLNEKEIPSNCIFNKIRTGCGGTTLEIKNNRRNSIIAVPFKNLIHCKVEAYKEGCEEWPELRVQGVYGGVRDSEIVDYLQNNMTHKIMCTWDSLGRVKKLIGEHSDREVSSYFLLVDEVHCMTNQYKFRKKAIDYILQTYREFENWCFMTATPVETDFSFDELREVEIKTAEGMQSLKPLAKVIEAPALMKEISHIIKFFLRSPANNAHIFINSVNLIVQALRHNPELTNENCKAVWGESNRENKEKLGDIERGLPHLPAKKINFYTSTSFEGCDIWDENGVVFIVVDGYREHTLTDIPTTFVQIIGRIRDSLYSEREVYLIYRPGKSEECVPWEDYRDSEKEQTEAARDIAGFINDKGDKARNYLPLFNNKRISHHNGVITVDGNTSNVDVLEYRNKTEIFASTENLLNAIMKLGMEVNYRKQEYSPAEKKLLDEKAKVPWKELCQEYVNLRKNKKVSTLIITLEELYPELAEYYQIIGPDRMEELNFEKKALKMELIRLKPGTMVTKIIELAQNKGISPGRIIPKKESARIFQEIYEHLGLKETVTALTIHKYFDAGPKRTGSDGNREYCWVIKTPKLVQA